MGTTQLYAQFMNDKATELGDQNKLNAYLLAKLVAQSTTDLDFQAWLTVQKTNLQAAATPAAVAAIAANHKSEVDKQLAAIAAATNVKAQQAAGGGLPIPK